MFKSISLCLLLICSSIYAEKKKTSALTHEIQLTLGDSSADGHGKTSVFLIKSNFSKKEVSTAYKAGSKLLNFNFSNEVAVDYEDSSFPKTYLTKLRAAGLTINILDEEDFQNDDYVSLDKDSFLKIWLSIAKLGNSKFKFEIHQPKHNLDIGGYGLF